eukprot:COSAG05_NODE_209_length_14039_cov_138.574892_5_plen_509_part_00
MPLPLPLLGLLWLLVGSRLAAPSFRPAEPGGGATTIELDNRTGAYTVVTARWRLPGGPIRIFCGGRWYCSDHQSGAAGSGGSCYAALLNACVNPATVGADALGEFHDRSIVWVSSDGVVQSLITQWRTYPQLGAVVFNTRMKSTCDNCSLPTQQPITHFPSLDVDVTTSRASGRLLAPELGWLTFGATPPPQQQQLIQSSGTGLSSLCRWNTATPGAATCGLRAGIPLVIFERSPGADTLLVAPLNTIGDISLARTQQPGTTTASGAGGALAWGLQGNLRSLDDGSAVYHDLTSAVLLLSGRGIRRTMAAWGAAMRRWYRRVPTNPATEPGLSHLGYATDPGSAYYYTTVTGTGPAARYNETFLRLREEAAAKGVRYRNWQLDSFWTPTQADNAPGLLNASCTWDPQRARTAGMAYWEGCRSPGFFPDALQPIVLRDMGDGEQAPAVTVATARWLSPQSTYITEYPHLTLRHTSAPYLSTVYAYQTHPISTESSVFYLRLSWRANMHA